MKSRAAGGCGCLLAIIVFFVTTLAVYFYVIWPAIANWGATGVEASAGLPGDHAVASPDLRTTRAVTVRAGPDRIWPWLMELGVDRGGMYSYDWLENLAGLNVHSTWRITPEWQSLRVGDFIRFTPPDYFLPNDPGVWVTGLNFERAMLGCLGNGAGPPEKCVRTWQFILQPNKDGLTRLMVRTNAQTGSTLGAALGKLFELPVFIMERRMLLGIKQRAEAVPAR